MTHILDNRNNNYRIAYNNKGMSHKQILPEERNVTDSFVVGKMQWLRFLKNSIRKDWKFWKTILFEEAKTVTFILLL